MKIWLGIDPGQSGGIACIGEMSNGRPSIPWAVKMPQTDKDILDELNFKERFELIGDDDLQIYACLERVHSMPGQGVSSSFKFGEGYGKLQMALIACKIPFDLVTPQGWQKELSCLTGGDKNVSKRRAQELFPEVLKITHATADALLLARFCQIKHP